MHECVVCVAWVFLLIITVIVLQYIYSQRFVQMACFHPLLFLSFSHPKGSSSLSLKKSKKKKKHKHKDRDVCKSSTCKCTHGLRRNGISVSHSCSLFAEERL